MSKPSPHELAEFEADCNAWFAKNTVTDGAALDAALELAARVAANGPLALVATKRIINERPDWSSAEMWSRQSEIAMPVFMSKGSREGALAFAEKRKPNWTGS
jgi:enoyl-CoA hydratase